MTVTTAGELLEALRLAMMLVVGGLAAGYVIRQWTVVRMARAIDENRELRQEVERLKIAFDKVLAENAQLRTEVEHLRADIKALDSLVQISKHGAEDWRAAAEQARRQA